ncbi:MAG: hypothetical protein B7Z12_05245 [Caulobacter vibrioides]|uniref:Uncharacterized protein n=1 Tax=Caulobacter vibrioides TaxID=155892 RepID=A0A258DAB1_CAUVI|nr:MAG: hypothetical protein B7Z12_05245 [Caulobacter vibrioides]
MKRGMTAGLAGVKTTPPPPSPLSHGERVGVRGYGARRRAGIASAPVTPHPPTAARRAPPSP